MATDLCRGSTLPTDAQVAAITAIGPPHSGRPRRFARRQLGFGAAAVTVRVVEPPLGEVAKVDFGLFGL